MKENYSQLLRFIFRRVTKMLVAGLLILQSVLVSAQMPNYKVSFGEFEVVSLLDGTVNIDAESLLYNREEGKATQLLHESFLKNPVEISINAFLIKADTKLILVDAGAGELFGGKQSGQIAESLQSAGYKPSQITDVLLTHIHADHSGGLTVAGKKIFENAIIHVNQLEYDFWLSKTNMANALANSGGANPKSFQNAADVLLPYIKAGKIKTFRSGDEVLKGVTTILAAGHTPGHTVYCIEDREEKMVFWGDLVHIASVQFIDPLMDDHFDVSLDKGKTQRVAFYKKVSDEKCLIAASHISFPGFGHLKSEGNKYVWIPVPYSVEGRKD